MKSIENILVIRVEQPRVQCVSADAENAPDGNGHAGIAWKDRCSKGCESGFGWNNDS